MATVQVNFTTEDEEYTMVFDDSYKSWREQLQEYIWQLNNHKTSFKIGEIYLSHSRFVQTGLKWCALEEYEAELRAIGDQRFISDFNWVLIQLPKVIKL